MVAILRLLIGALRDCIMSRGRLEAEVIVLRHQLNILRRQSPRRVRPNAFERAVFVCLYRHCPDIGNAVAIIRPETVIRWHRMGFRAWWRWKSRNPGGRSKIDPELRDLVRRMCAENPLWGAPRIHGELLKLGFTVTQSTVSKYMLRGRRTPAQGWKTFLRNHADGIAAVDFLVVPTLTFERLFAFVILGVGERATGSIRRECLDHMIVWSEAHLRRVLREYTSYYNAARTHLGLQKDAPHRRPIERRGRIVTSDVLGGLHHQYCRI